MSIESPQFQKKDVETPNATDTAQMVEPTAKVQSREGWTRGQRIAAVGSLVTVLAGGAVAANHFSSNVEAPVSTPAEDDNETPAPAATQPVEVSPTNITPLETATPTASATSETVAPVAEFSVKELEAMTPERFNSLSFESKAPYLKSILKDAKKRVMYFTSTDELYRSNPLDIAKETNTPQEIAMQLWYGFQLVHAQPKSEDLNDHTLDTEKATKALSVPFYSTESNTTPTYNFLEREIASGTPAGIVQDNYTNAKETSPVEEILDHEGNSIKVRTISFQNNGKLHTWKVTLRDLDGESSVWQLYEEVF